MGANWWYKRTNLTLSVQRYEGSAWVYGIVGKRVYFDIQARRRKEHELRGVIRVGWMRGAMLSLEF